MRELEISAAISIIFCSSLSETHLCICPLPQLLPSSSICPPEIGINFAQSTRQEQLDFVPVSLSRCDLAGLQLDMFIACHKSSSSRLAHSLPRSRSLPRPLPLPHIALHVLWLRERRCKHRVGASIFTLISFEALQSSSITQLRRLISNTSPYRVWSRLGQFRAGEQVMLSSQSPFLYSQKAFQLACFWHDKDVFLWRPLEKAKSRVGCGKLDKSDILSQFSNANMYVNMKNNTLYYFSTFLKKNLIN